MPLDQFTNEAYEGLAAGKEEVLVGLGQTYYDAFEPRRQECFQDLIEKTGEKKK